MLMTFPKYTKHREHKMLLLILNQIPNLHVLEVCEVKMKR